VLRLVLFIAFSCLIALVSAPPTAFSRPLDSHSPKSKRSHKKKKQKNRVNMPKGWMWPPSPAMKAEGEVCLERLTALGVKWRKADVTHKVTTPIYVPDMTLGGVVLESIWRKGPFVMDCVLALAIAERGGPALRNIGVTKLRFAGIHDYREVAGKRGVLSRHALGLAMDVYEFVDDEGLVHVVAKDYTAGDELLPVIEQAARGTGAFRTVLTPGNDPKHHYDHFHFEARTEAEEYWGPELKADQAQR
jgi:hypothetical protein